MIQTFLYRMAALSAASILFTLEIAISNPQPVNSHYPIVSQSDASLPICYMHTTGGITLDLSNMCKKTTRKPAVNSENSPPRLEPATPENPPLNESPLAIPLG